MKGPVEVKELTIPKAEVIKAGGQAGAIRAAGIDLSAAVVYEVWTDPATGDLKIVMEVPV